MKPLTKYVQKIFEDSIGDKVSKQIKEKIESILELV